MTRPRCGSPLDPATLADYWLEELSSAEENAVEEHLLACAECSASLQAVAALGDALRALTRKGLLPVSVSDGFLERLESEGLRIRQYRLAPGGDVACTIGAQDDLVVARLEADLAGAGRVDLARCDAAGREVARQRDVPLAAERREVLWTEPTDVLRALTKAVIVVRLVSVEAGGERVLGEYTFNHTGPGPDSP